MRSDVSDGDTITVLDDAKTQHKIRLCGVDAPREGHEEFQAEAQFTAKRVYLELARIARADVRGLYDKDGNLRPVHELDDDTAAAVAGIEVHEDFLGTEGGDKVPVGQTTKIKLRNKLEALKALGEYHGMFRKDGAKELVMIVNIKI